MRRGAAGESARGDSGAGAVASSVDARREGEAEPGFAAEGSARAAAGRCDARASARVGAVAPTFAGGGAFDARDCFGNSPDARSAAIARSTTVSCAVLALALVSSPAPEATPWDVAELGFSTIDSRCTAGAARSTDADMRSSTGPGARDRSTGAGAGRSLSIRSGRGKSTPVEVRIGAALGDVDSTCGSRLVNAAGGALRGRAVSLEFGSVRVSTSR